MNAYTGVYKLIDRKTGVYYIGSTGNLRKRLAQHLSDLSRGQHRNTRLQQHTNDDTVWELEVAYIVSDRDEAYAVEQQLLDLSKEDPKCLNISVKAKGSVLAPESPEYRSWYKNLLASIIARYEAMSPEDRRTKHGQFGKDNGMYGKSHSDDVRRILSENMVGNSRAKGVKRTDEQRRRLSELAKLRIQEKNPFFGRTHSDMTRKRLSEWQLAHPKLPGNAQRVKIGESIYQSVREAAKDLGISAPLLIHRIKSNSVKYAEYSYL